jgi:hypothetical protein
MEDIGDYIYYIFIAIAVIASLFGKSKKKTVPRNPNPTETAPSDWGEVFGELFGTEKPQPQPQPQPVLRSATPPVAKPKTVTKKNAYKPISQLIDEIVTTSEGMRAIKSAETETLDMEKDTAGFSLDDIPNEAGEWRKVFVYNEIFNRKY